MIFSHFKLDHKADDSILIKYQKMSLIQQSYFIRGKNPTAFQGTGNRKQVTGNREQRIGKSFRSFIYFLICHNLCADCYITKNGTELPLTPAEARVFWEVIQGLTNKQISDRLFISPRTVQTHLSKVENSLLVSSLCL